jgi:hypothetical protein
MGYDQKEPILKYAKTLNLNGTIKFYKDLNNHDRGFVYKQQI